MDEENILKCMDNLTLKESIPENINNNPNFNTTDKNKQIIIIKKKKKKEINNNQSILWSNQKYQVSSTNDKEAVEENNTNNNIIINTVIQNKNYEDNKTNLNKKQQQVDLLFKPNEEGISDWITKENISQNSILNWGNNGVARHGIYFNDNRFIWEKYPINGKIEKLRTNGFNDKNLNSNLRPIRKDIDKYYKQSSCVVCGSKSDLVTDHKNDLYNDPRVLNTSTQVLNDFQCLCNHCNLQKRQVAKKTKETRKRYGATNIPFLKIFGINFIEGDENYDPKDINAMKGTFWYDPIEFMNYLKKTK